LGKVPTTLRSSGCPDIDPAQIAEAIVDSYVEAYAVDVVEASHERLPTQPAQVERDPPWSATCEEAIGLIGAGPDAGGVFRVGGDLLVSRDALRSLEARSSGVSGQALRMVVSEALAAPGVALEGVRSLESVCSVIERGRSQSEAT
jgi:hypothetical protein